MEEAKIQGQTTEEEGGLFFLDQLLIPVCVDEQLPLQSSITFTVIAFSMLEGHYGPSCVILPSVFVWDTHTHIYIYKRNSREEGNRPCGLTTGLQHLIEANRCVAAAVWFALADPSNHTHLLTSHTKTPLNTEKL